MISGMFEMREVNRKSKPNDWNPNIRAYYGKKLVSSISKVN